MADDIVYDRNNPYPGQVIRDNVMMENLYENVVVDYKLEEITPSDLKKILLGQKSEALPMVLESTEGDNVLLTGGPINGQSGKTNTIKIETI